MPWERPREHHGESQMATIGGIEREPLEKPQGHHWKGWGFTETEKAEGVPVEGPKECYWKGQEAPTGGLTVYQ